MKAGELNWDVQTMEDKLKRLTDIAPEHLTIITTIWANERDKVSRVDPSLSIVNPLWGLRVYFKLSYEIMYLYEPLYIILFTLVCIHGLHFYQAHNQKIKESRWNNSFKSLSWRVDVEAMSKDNPESGEPVALFEFVTTKGSKDSTGKEIQIAKFEMNRIQVADLAKICDEIQMKFDSF